MPKHFIAALLGLSSLATHAQTILPAGTIQLGGSIGYSQRHNEDATYGSSVTDYRTFGIMPQVGYFVAPGWVLGLSAGYNSTKQRVCRYGHSLLQHAAV